MVSCGNLNSFYCKCGKSFDKKTSLRSHARFCKEYEKIVSVSKYKNLDSYQCECEKEFKNSQSLNSHFSHCSVHRENKGKLSSRNYFHSKEGKMNGWDKFTEEERNRFFKKAGNTIKEKINSGILIPHWIGKKHTKESKEKMSRSASENNNGFVNCKYFEVYCPFMGKNIKLQGTYEKSYAEYLNVNKINWIKDKDINLSYKLNEDDFIHKYHPDFYLPDSDEYVEIKGYWWKSKDGRVDDRRKMDCVILCNPDKVIKILETRDLKKLKII